MKTTLYTILSILLLNTTAFAIPVLQLDISDGLYDTSTETIVSTTDSFTLYAIIDKGLYTSDPTREYYISMALMSKTEDINAGAFGSFAFNGETINVTAGMTYGTPPVDDLVKDLAGHGAFPTYYAERMFSLPTTPAMTTGYNTEDNPGGLIANPDGSHAYVAFDVDVSLLDPEYEIHFDLYTYTFIDGDKNKIEYFAPWSHDAESGGSPVPEPATLFLFGIGLLGMAGVSRKNII